VSGYLLHLKGLLAIPFQPAPHLFQRYPQVAADEDRPVILVKHGAGIVGLVDNLDGTANASPALRIAADMDDERAVIAAAAPTANIGYGRSTPAASALP
jgi:hypothetical protein